MLGIHASCAIHPVHKVHALYLGGIPILSLCYILGSGLVGVFPRLNPWLRTHVFSINLGIKRADLGLNYTAKAPQRILICVSASTISTPKQRIARQFFPPPAASRRHPLPASTSRDPVLQDLFLHVRAQNTNCGTRGKDLTVMRWLEPCGVHRGAQCRASY